MRFVIIDEKSMLDLHILSLIDDQLRLIFLDHADAPFSRLNVLLYGDFFQLPLVGGCALFTVSVKALAAIKGQLLY